MSSRPLFIKLSNCAHASRIVYAKYSGVVLDAGVEQLERVLHELFERRGDGRYVAYCSNRRNAMIEQGIHPPAQERDALKSPPLQGQRLQHRKHDISPTICSA